MVLSEDLKSGKLGISKKEIYLRQVKLDALSILNESGTAEAIASMASGLEKAPDYFEEKDIQSFTMKALFNQTPIIVGLLIEEFGIQEKQEK